MKITKEILEKVLIEKNNSFLLQYDDINFSTSDTIKVVDTKNQERMEQIMSDKIKEVIMKTQEELDNTDEFGDTAVKIDLAKYEYIVKLHKETGAKLILDDEYGESILAEIVSLLSNMLKRGIEDPFKTQSNDKRIISQPKEQKEAIKQLVRKKLSNIDLSWIDIRNLSDLSSLFKNTDFTTIDITGWNTKGVSNFEKMFADMDNLQAIYGIEDFDLSSAYDISSMFDNCGTKELKLDLSKWNTSKVRYFKDMFAYFRGTSLGDLGNWRFDKIDTIGYISSGIAPKMFYEAENLQYIGDISNWNIIDKSVQMEDFFNGTGSLKNVGDLSKWGNNKFISITDMFYASAIKTDLSSWTMLNVKSEGYGKNKNSFNDYNNYNLGLKDSSIPKKYWPELYKRYYKQYQKYGF